MDPFLLSALRRDFAMAAILGVICFGILWGGPRLLRTFVGDVWWLRWGPKLAYSIVLIFGLPAILAVRYGNAGLQAYAVTGVFLAVVLFIAGLLAKS
jgi:hypothetical protein